MSFLFAEACACVLIAGSGSPAFLSDAQVESHTPSREVIRGTQRALIHLSRTGDD